MEKLLCLEILAEEHSLREINEWFIYRGGMGVLNSIIFPPRIVSFWNSVGRWFLVPWLQISFVGLRFGRLFIISKPQPRLHTCPSRSKALNYLAWSQLCIHWRSCKPGNLPYDVLKVTRVPFKCVLTQESKLYIYILQ